jgi:hypothetical protein
VSDASSPSAAPRSLLVRRFPFRRLACAALPLTLLVAHVLAGCSSAEKTSSASTSTGTNPATALRGKRYCEVLLLHESPAGFTADVYVSFPMNDCPEAAWKALDAAKLADENQVPIALLNGPRYWLMDRIDKEPETSGPTKLFGGIEMTMRASVFIGELATASKPYQLREVGRKTAFTFAAGATVYELTDPLGQRFVMQSWSQQVDADLVEAELVDLASRLGLPSGWSYASRTLEAPLVIDSTGAPAKVTTDALRNTYSLAPE